MALFSSQEHRPVKRPRLGNHGPDVYPQNPRQKEVRPIIIEIEILSDN